MIDTVNKQFIFKHQSINNPIGIDTFNNKIVNVKYINDVDISKMIGGLRAGDGIIVDDVEDSKFETSDEMKAIDDKFVNYTITNDLQDSYATKEELNLVKARFDDYDDKAAIQDTYATKESVKTIDDKFDNYLKKGDLPATELQFTVDNGFPYFTVKNDYISTDEDTTTTINVNNNLLMIDVPAEIKTKILDSTFKKLVDVFNFIIRKQYMFKDDVTLTTEFIAYINNDTIFHNTMNCSFR